jgi:microcin C transport system substrate-binding protein
VRRAFNLAFDFELVNKMTFNGMYLRVGSFFDGGELKATGLPQGRELELLNEVRNDGVPPEAFTTEWTNPVNVTRDDYRRHMAEAMKLFNEAGWTLQDKRLVNAKGEQFTVEFLVPLSEIVGVVDVYASELKTLGIDARVRVVDSSQYQRRERSRDFDIIIDRLAQSFSPGNEQREFWSSAAADMPGSRNNMGLKNAAVDKLIDKIIFAPNRAELVAATQALDRVLLWSHMIVPHWEYPFERIAYWDKFGRPGKVPSQQVAALRTWWIDPEKEKALNAARPQE